MEIKTREIVLSPSLTNGLSKLGSLTGRMRFGEMDWVDTHLDWKLWEKLVL